jgi:hypothetical protein
MPSVSSVKTSNKTNDKTNDESKVLLNNVIPKLRVLEETLIKQHIQYRLFYSSLRELMLKEHDKTEKEYQANMVEIRLIKKILVNKRRIPKPSKPPESAAAISPSPQPPPPTTGE